MAVDDVVVGKELLDVGQSEVPHVFLNLSSELGLDVWVHSKVEQGIDNQSGCCLSTSYEECSAFIFDYLVVVFVKIISQ